MKKSSQGNGERFKRKVKRIKIKIQRRSEQIIWAPLSVFRSQSFHFTSLRKKDFRSSRGALRKVEDLS
jgi:hypothetical protein